MNSQVVVKGDPEVDDVQRPLEQGIPLSGALNSKSQITGLTLT